MFYKTQKYQFSCSRDQLTIHNLRFCNSLLKMRVPGKALKALTVIHYTANNPKEATQHGF